jgi:hypothetical protein
MATLVVENVPEDLYAALQKLAEEQAEVIERLRLTVPTQPELARRRELFERMREIQSRPSPGPVRFPRQRR